MSQPSHLVLLFLLILSAPLFLNACGKNLTAEEYVLQAKEHIQTGDLRAANIELANALQRDPEAVEARWLMAQVALDLGDAATAESEARRALQLGMPDTQVRPLLVKSLLRQGAFDRVLSETVALPSEASDTDKAEMLGMRGQAFVLKGDLERSRAAFEDAKSLDPEAPQALLGLAVWYAVQGQVDEGRQRAVQALDLHPNLAEGWTVLGELALAQGDAEAAEAAFGNAIEQRAYPTLDRAHRALARIQLGKLEEAAADIRTLQRRGHDQHPYVQYVSGRTQFSERNFAEAANAFEASFNADPSSLANRMYLATTRLLLGQPEQARLHAQYVYSNIPDSPEAARLLGAARIGLNEYAGARRVLEASLRESPDDRTVLGMLATATLLEGDAATSVEHLRRLAVLDPDSQQVQGMLMLAKLISGEALDADIGGGVLVDPADVDEEDYSEAFLRALAAFRDGRLGEALQRSRRLHERYPERIDPLNLMAASYLAGGHWDLAKVEFEKVLELQPNEPNAMFNLAKVEIQTGDVSRGRSLLQELLNEQPTSEEVLLLLAEAEVRLGNRPAGMQVLEQLLRSSPGALTARAKLAGEYLRDGNQERVLELTGGLSNAQLRAEPAMLELRGKAQMQQGDVAAARATFEQWTRLAPDSAEAQFLYSDSLARSGDAVGARQALERTIQLDPGHVQARVGEVKMLVHLGEVDKARAALAALTEDFGDRVEVLGIEGWFALGTGDHATAEQRLAAVWEQRPDSEVAILLARAMWAQGKHEETFALLEGWLEQQPQDLAVLLHLAGGLLSQGRDMEAISTYRRVIEIQPDHVPSLNNIAWLSRETEPERAMEYAERAYQLAPDDPHVLDTMGMLRLQQGDLVGAHDFIRAAAERSPNDAQIQLHLAAVLARQERLDEAREVLEVLVQQVPDTEPGREARTLLESMPVPGP